MTSGAASAWPARRRAVRRRAYDDYYDEGVDGGYEDYPEGYGQPAQDSYRGYEPQEPGNGMLGQTRRGEAESVAVYTRSGQLVGEADRHATTYGPSVEPTCRPGAYDTPSSYAQAQSQRAALSSVPTTAPVSSTEARVNAVLEGTPQLPAYVLRPESYDDVETVVRRVRTRQPVVLVFAGRPAPRSPSACSISAMDSLAAPAPLCASSATACSSSCRWVARSRRPTLPSCVKTAISSSRSCHLVNAITIARLVRTLFEFYNYLILGYVLLSWFPIRPGSLMDDIGAVLQSLVGPYLNFFRRFIPPLGMIDWSPVVAILVLSLLENFIIRLIL